MRKITLPILLLAAGLAACGTDRRTSNGEGKANGQRQTTTMQQGGNLKEFGSGEHAIILSNTDSPTHYCWFLKETKRICRENGYVSNRTSHTNSCVDEAPDCLAIEPQGSTEENDRCYLRQSWRTVGNEALPGSCEKLAAYWDDDPAVQCLFHGQCGDNEQCVDYQCVCPEGADCTVLMPGGPSTMDPDPDPDPNPDPDPDPNPDPDPDPDPNPQPEPECRVDADCPVGPSPAGVCTTAQCVGGACVTSSEPC